MYGSEGDIFIIVFGIFERNVGQLDVATCSLYKILDMGIFVGHAMREQVRELNLLRESNAELREENKKSLEDCRVSYFYSGPYCSVL